MSNKHTAAIRKSIMKATAKKLKVGVTEFSANSFRLRKEGYVTIDYYPKSNRCFFHDCHEYGEVTDTRIFITHQFSKQ